MKRKKKDSMSDDKEIQLLSFIAKTPVPVVTSSFIYQYKDLLEYSMETCSFCQAIFHTKYDHYVHLAKHLVIKVPRVVVKQEKPSSTASQESSKHDSAIKVPDKFNCKKLIVKVENFADLLKQKENFERTASSEDVNTDRNDTDSKNIDNASEIIKARSRLVDDIKNDILKSIVTKIPVVKCQDDLAELVRITKTGKKLENNLNGIQKGVNDNGHSKNDIAIIKKVNSQDNIVNKKSISMINDSQSHTVNRGMNIINLVDDDSNSETDIMILGDVAKRMVGENELDNTKTKSNDLKAAKNHVEQKEFTKRKKKKSYITDDVTITRVETTVAETSKTNTKINTSFEFEEPVLPTYVGKPIKSEESSFKIENMIPSFDSDHIENETPDLFQSKTSNIRCRLIFEDDSDEDMTLLEKLQEANTTESTLNKANDNKEDGTYVLGKIMLGKKAEFENNEKDVFKSVHFEDLQKPGVYFCRHCSKVFPNKYSLVCHEMKHIKIKQRRPTPCYICDRYIPGSYHCVRQHIERSHPGYDATKKVSTNTCPKCKLKYHMYKKHINNYHYIYVCKVCGTRFESEDDRSNHLLSHQARNDFASSFESFVSKCNESVLSYDKMKAISEEKIECKDSVAAEYEEGRTRKICNVCCMFLKNNKSLKYKVMGDYSRVGKKQTCEKCQKNHFAVKLVKTFRRKMENNSRRPALGPTTAKLKVIQKRLKMLNTLTRF